LRAKNANLVPPHGRVPCQRREGRIDDLTRPGSSVAARVCRPVNDAVTGICALF
jgi:hypothetical protein